MRFADIRPTIFKRTPADDGFSESAATPRRLSPKLTPTSGRFKPEFDDASLLQPTYNRAGRRASGQTKPRKRLRQNGPTAHWLPVRKAQIELEKRRAAKELEMSANGQ